MPTPRLPHVALWPTSTSRRTRRLPLLAAAAALLLALVGCGTPTPPPPPDVDDVVLLVTNYSDHRVEVMGAKDVASDLAARPAASFEVAANASAISAVWGPGDRIYVSDFALGRILVYDAETALESAAPATVAVITSPDLLEPYAMAFDGASNLWVSDRRGSRAGDAVANRVVKLTSVAAATGATSLDAATVVTFDDTTLAFGTTWITGLYFDQQDDLWFSDTWDWAVSRVSDPASLSGVVLGLVPDLRLQSVNGIDADLSDIRNPVGMAVDAAGNLYVGNHGRDRVARFDGAATLAGDYTGSTRQADATLAVNLFNTPLIALAPDDSLWVGSSGPGAFAQLVRVTGQEAGSGEIALTPTAQFNWSSVNTNAYHEAGGMLFHTR